MKTLQETVPGMLSSDWKERLVAEIEQLDIRLYNLEYHMEKIGEDSPEYSLLKAQRDSMTEYLKTLTARATTFGVDYLLPSVAQRFKDKTPNLNDMDPMFRLILAMFLMNVSPSDKGGE